MTSVTADKRIGGGGERSQKGDLKEKKRGKEGGSLNRFNRMEKRDGR